MISQNMSRAEIESIGKNNATNLDKAKIIGDFYLYTDLNELSVGRWLSSTGYWESWVTSWFTKNIKPGYVCLDVGANYGYYTRIMEKLSGSSGIVHSIEANPHLIDLINKSIKEFPIVDGAKVILHSVAVSDKEGDVILKIPSKHLGGSSIVYYTHELPSNIPTEDWDVDISVKSNIIDNIISGHVDLIKLDIEGAEPLAWKGMKKILDNTDTIIVELGSYSPDDFLDEIYKSYNVWKVDFEGEEIPLSRTVLDQESDLIMAVLRRK